MPARPYYASWFYLISRELSMASGRVRFGVKLFAACELRDAASFIQ
jgi:hypothetical protein